MTENLNDPTDYEIFDERHDGAGFDMLKIEINSVGWSGLIPFRNFLTDRPWSLLWVQFLAFVFGFPFLLNVYYQSGDATLKEAAWAFATYFSIVWAVLIHRCLRPERLGMKKIVGTWLATSGIFLNPRVRLFLSQVCLE